VAQADFDYDGMNNRLRQVDYTGATTTIITYTNDILGLSQVLVADDGTERVVNLFGHDLVHQDDGMETRTLLADGLGSVRLEMTDDEIETTTTYSPYGDTLAQNGTSGTEYGFTGEQRDNSTGLLYLRARYYNFGLRTFMGRDPWSGQPRLPQTMNGWSYANNNPVNLVDPNGENPLVIGTPVIIGGAVIIVGALTIYAIASTAPEIDCPPSIDWDRLFPFIPSLGALLETLREKDAEIVPESRPTARDIEQNSVQVWPRVQPVPAPEPLSQPQPEGEPTPLPPIPPDLPDENPKQKHISLSRWEYHFNFWFGLNQRLNPQNIFVYQAQDWFPEGLSAVPAAGDLFPEAFDQATKRAMGIHFNLQGIENPNEYAEKHGGNGVFSAKDYYTAWELYKIKNNPQLCVKTSFYEDGIIPSATAKRNICNS
jgi:RHS repeat-associated protein